MHKPTREQIAEFAVSNFEEGSHPRALSRDARIAFGRVTANMVADMAKRPGLWSRAEAQCGFWMFKAGKLADVLCDIAQEDEVTKPMLMRSLETLSSLRKTVVCQALGESLKQASTETETSEIRKVA